MDRTSRRLLNVNETAVYLNTSRWSVYKLVRDGHLRAVRVGERLRFKPDDVERYLDRDGEPGP